MDGTIKTSYLIAATLLLTAGSALATFLDVFLLRQILGLILLTLLPGILIVFILGLEKHGWLTSIVLSVGLSVSFTLILGIIVNGILPGFGYSQPLSFIYLFTSFVVTVSALTVVAIIKKRDSVTHLPQLNFATTDWNFLLLASLLPLLSIIGAFMLNVLDNNLLLIILSFAIILYVIGISLYHRKINEKVYPVAIFFIAAAIVLRFSLRTSHLIGSDVHLEYWLFTTTLDNLRWTNTGMYTLDAAVSISLLPAIYKIILNLDPEYLFKLLFSGLSMITPLLVYMLAKRYVGSFYAFFSSFLFMSQIIFVQASIYTRADIGIFLFALILVVLFHESIDDILKTALFLVFSFALIVSYYSVAYILFFMLMISWILIQALTQRSKFKTAAIFKRQKSSAKDLKIPSRNPARKGSGNITGPPKRRTSLITFTMAFLFYAMVFLWYGLMTGAPLYNTNLFIIKTFTNLNGLFSLEARNGNIQEAFLHPTGFFGIPQQIELILTWLIFIFLAIGLVYAILNWKTKKGYTFKNTRLNLSKDRFGLEFTALALTAGIMILADAFSPVISQYYGGTRTYFQMLVILSVFFTIGVIALFQYVKVVPAYLKARPEVLILALLLPYFLCTTGVTAQLAGFQRDVALNSPSSENALQSVKGNIIFDDEVASGKWLAKNQGAGANFFLATKTRQLAEYGIQDYYVHALSEYSNYTPPRYIFLKNFDVEVAKTVENNANMFSDTSKLYDSGGSQIFQ